MKSMALLKKSFLVVAVMILMTSFAAEGAVYDNVYKGPDGFQVISYSPKWNDIHKLQSVYEELLRNAHGEELKLLNKIIIYPGPNAENPNIEGTWFGEWSEVNGKPRLKGNCFIHIYNGDRNDTIESIARTLSHEYGHHFTYYHYFKSEQKSWEQWRSSKLAGIRGIISNPLITADGADHMWLIQEIAAEDYFQLLGSPTGKPTYDFMDIRETLASDKRGWVFFSAQMYNFTPQENFTLPLAANINGLREYWQESAGLQPDTNTPPTPVNLRLKKTEEIPDLELRQYIFEWDKSTDDKSKNLEYTLVCYGKDPLGEITLRPVKTTTHNQSRQAVFGATRLIDLYMQEELLDPGFFVVYTRDEDNLIVSSKVLVVDFSNYKSPQTILLDDFDLSKGLPVITVKVDGNQINFDVKPVIEKGRTMVPLRGIFEALGATLQWDGSTQTIKAQKGEKEVILSIGDTEASVNGSTIILDTPPKIVNGRTLVPLRFVSEALGANVTWNEKLRCASITS